jgi:hypothetical protein
MKFSLLFLCAECNPVVGPRTLYAACLCVCVCVVCFVCVCVLCVCCVLCVLCVCVGLCE